MIDIEAAYEVASYIFGLNLDLVLYISSLHNHIMDIPGWNDLIISSALNKSTQESRNKKSKRDLRYEGISTSNLFHLSAQASPYRQRRPYYRHPAEGQCISQELKHGIGARFAALT